ncbi:receptor-like protein EIX1 [Hevea brasiliensis]|uniref:receptor-like protein EIX1 n=1 Tax=Hevea brasiliensis TaxID=3981 RepID=UPI0025DCDCFE|nr:receptor-like protein EIX1 [Hevea brasiliensis]
MGSILHELVTMFIFIAYVFMVTTEYSLGVAALKVQCIDSEQKALQNFKEGFHSHLDRFSSWVPEEDCCKWRGVRCENETGHVITLDLHSSDSSEAMQGQLRESLLDLPYLSYLDLSLNDFLQIQIPEFIGSLSRLKYLNLSNANFRGTIPDQLGNLSHLVSLDLSGNGYSLRVNNLNWLYHLSPLKFLDLGGVDLSISVNWLDDINMLSSLIELNLSACKLHNLPQSLPLVNFTSLKILDLSFNSLNGTIPDWLFEIDQSLVFLYLRRNEFHGSIPEAFGNMTSLIVLDLSENNLEGPIPTTLGMISQKNQSKEFSSLRQLYLYHNQLNGSLQKILPKLSRISVLDVSWNSLEGVVTDAELLDFSNLQVLDFSGNNLTLNVSSSWAPSFQLERIGLNSCKLGPQFPQWLRTQKHFSAIDISMNGISDAVPDWFWNLSSKIRHVNLSSNVLTGTVPDLSSKIKLSTIDLSLNKLSGPLPLLSSSISTACLAGNLFSGPIFRLCEMLKVNNSVRYLDFSNNTLSGQIPDCWTHGKNLVILNLASNNLSGKIPESIGHLLQLNSLRFDHNGLSGKIPSSLKNCTSLIVLDLGQNRFSGEIPEWIGENLLKLMILGLSSNAFKGHIPVEVCLLESLKILDLSANYLSGGIPRCVDNFKAMAERDTVRSYIYDPYTAYIEDVILTAKGLQLRYGEVLKYVKLLDLSSNGLTGEIPQGITSLIGLLFLNLSRNNLVGAIPANIGAMHIIESLDLSRNQLSCSIPTSMTDLFSLSCLDLSHNRLSGSIPSGHQFDTFDAATYQGNHNLCGPPLAYNCSEDKSYEDPNCIDKEVGRKMEAETGHRLHIPPFYMSMGLGFIVGFWGFWGPLLLKTSWRHAYFRCLGNLIDQIYVRVIVAVARLQRKFQKQAA